MVLADTDTIGVDEFPQIASQVTGFVSSGSVAPALTICQAPAEPAPGAAAAAAAGSGYQLGLPIGMPPPSMIALLDGNGDVRALEVIEAETIRFAISHYRGQMSEVARRLRIGRSTLYRKVDLLGHDADLSGTEASALYGHHYRLDAIMM